MRVGGSSRRIADVSTPDASKRLQDEVAEEVVAQPADEPRLDPEPRGGDRDVRRRPARPGGERQLHRRGRVLPVDVRHDLAQRHDLPHGLILLLGWLAGEHTPFAGNG